MSSSTARKYAESSTPTNWCTATYAESRPLAVDSSASSAAAKRSSTGKVTGSRRRSTSAITARTASAAAARGSDHSDSVNRTRRLLTKTLWLSSSRRLPEASRPVSRPSAGLSAGNRRPVRCSRPRPVLFSSSSVSQVRHRAPGAAGSSVRRLRHQQRGRRPRQGVELDVVTARRHRVEVVEQLGQRARLLDLVQPERRDGLQLHLATARPSAPSDTRAASRTSGSAAARSCTVPSAATSRPPTIAAERLGNAAPVPCVPVASAPARVWVSTSPRLASARPRGVQLGRQPAQGDAGLDAGDSGRPRRRRAARPAGTRRPARRR